VDVEGLVYDVVCVVFVDVWGVELVDMGIGGFILFIVDFVVIYFDVVIFVIGVEDFDICVYGVDESLYFGEFEWVCVVEVVFFECLVFFLC